MTFILFVAITGCKTSSDPNHPDTIKYSIAGTVTTYNSATGAKPFPGVTVGLSYPDSNETTTNNFGTYRFDNIPSGNYFLYFTKTGFVPLSQNIHVDSNITFNIEMYVTFFDTSIIMEHVQNQNSAPIVGTKMAGEGDSVYTDVSGNATFRIPHVSGSAPFTFSVSNYLSQSKFIKFEHGEITYDTTTLIHK